MFKERKIWLDGANNPDTYVDFYGKFTYGFNEKVELNIVCDGAFTFYLNGQKEFFGACADFPNDKEFYTFDITDYCKVENDFKVTVWHVGNDSFTYIKDDAFLAFNITCGGEILAFSGEHISACINPNYVSGLRKDITMMLGYSYAFDNTVNVVPCLSKSKEYGYVVARRRIAKNLRMEPAQPFEIISTESGYIIDLKKETVGFLYLDIESDKQQKMLISYGERLVEGHVPRIIEKRDFSVEFYAKKGKNVFTNTFRRLAGRYLEILVKDIKINALTIKPIVYPLVEKNVDFNDAFIKKVYETCVYTLKCCMHEHYEDCPWREQSLYTMDSRNQMLCGYYAFEGFEFQKENILLIANSLRKDGLLSICAPAGIDLPIPFFSLIYVVQVCEYIEYSGDKSILNKVIDVVRTLKNTFQCRIDNNNLIPSFGKGYWNFYEWSKGSDHENEPDEMINGRYDLILNCAYVYTCKYFDKLLDETTDNHAILNAIEQNFFNKEKGLYKLDNFTDNYSVLGNSFALLIGLGDEGLVQKIIQGDGLVDITLSMKTFFYDALLKADGKYSKFILENIKKDYSYMLSQGATTFWETIKGAEDFNGAGSLCHGWSAMPVYYYNKILGD